VTISRGLALLATSTKKAGIDLPEKVRDSLNDMLNSFHAFATDPISAPDKTQAVKPAV
jgi:hypothetical protein